MDELSIDQETRRVVIDQEVAEVAIADATGNGWGDHCTVRLFALARPAVIPARKSERGTGDEIAATVVEYLVVATSPPDAYGPGTTTVAPADTTGAPLAGLTFAFHLGEKGVAEVLDEVGARIAAAGGS